MKRTLSLAVAVVLLASVMFCSGAARGGEKEVKALFIGNSLTSMNNLPRMVADVAKSHGRKVVYTSHAPGGARLAHHAADPAALAKIKEKAWDFVVLQEQSQYPGFGKKQLERDVYPYGKRLAQAVRKAHKRSKVVFYMAMARRNGDPDNSRVSRDLLTYEGMQKRVSRCYLQMARRNKAWVAPVGEVWRTVRKEKPALNLYSDDVHPNQTGAYLAACVFYVTFYGQTCVGSSIPRGVDRATAQYIQKTVDRIVLKQRKKWNLSKSRG